LKKKAQQAQAQAAGKLGRAKAGGAKLSARPVIVKKKPLIKQLANRQPGPGPKAGKPRPRPAAAAGGAPQSGVVTVTIKVGG
jgi:hypothetical protein